MIRVNDVLCYFEKLAPIQMKLDFDNVGLLVGDGSAEVRRVLVALDVTDDVIDEAIDLEAELIVAHHPIILEPLKRVTDGDRVGRKILKLARHEIAAICMHTNLDAAAGGINDVLAERLGLSGTVVLWKTGEMNGVSYGLGRVGTLPHALSMADFMPEIKRALDTSGLRYHDAGRPVHKVAVMGGSGGDALPMAVAAGCDTYVLGEAKYHAFVEARELGINLIEADHYCTENVISTPLQQVLRAALPGLDVMVSERHDQVVRFF